MAASDYAPSRPKYRLRLTGRPQMGSGRFAGCEQMFTKNLICADIAMYKLHSFAGRAMSESIDKFLSELSHARRMVSGADWSVRPTLCYKVRQSVRVGLANCGRAPELSEYANSVVRATAQFAARIRPDYVPNHQPLLMALDELERAGKASFERHQQRPKPQSS